MTIRALFRAAAVQGASAPYDTLHLKVFYPGQLSKDDQTQNFGMVPADLSQAPFPIVIFLNGINCGTELYQWLAVTLAERGLVVVTFNWVAENIPGMVALTPGVDLAMMAPTQYGTGPTATALPTIIRELEDLQRQGVLAGLLDLDRIILGGHSAGGRVAIENASPTFFSNVVAAFAYGAHSAATVQLGYEAGKILPLPDQLPLLLMGGTRDGVIFNSSHRYGITWEQAQTPVVRTFQEAIAGGRNDSYLCIVEGANHFSIADGVDGTTGRPFLDYPETQPAETLRSLLAETIGLFIDAHVRAKEDAIAALDQRLRTPPPLIVQWERA
ncbi:MAG: dienelactone hydrolase [Leptolyngbya sp. DLM2.Bin15]|nr:MAG: dienelactone hydrolase [Leptolyngbya sp. DLM2.Bin15]